MSFLGDDETTEEHERRITRCKACRAQIVFLPTAAGKPMPVDADSVEPDDKQFDANKHKSHFATCTQADDFRRGR